MKKWRRSDPRRHTRRGSLSPENHARVVLGKHSGSTSKTCDRRRHLDNVSFMTFFYSKSSLSSSANGKYVTSRTKLSLVQMQSRTLFVVSIPSDYSWKALVDVYKFLVKINNQLLAKFSIFLSSQTSKNFLLLLWRYSWTLSSTSLTFSRCKNGN